MIYRKSECCITPEDLSGETLRTEGYRFEDRCSIPRDKNCYEKEDDCGMDLARRLSEMQFAAIDLNLFLDTHPCDEEALAMHKKINKTLESLKYDYVKKYGPLCAGDSSDKAPFEWVGEEYKWPWEK